MKYNKYNRRKFLTTVSACTAAGLFMNTIPFSGANAQTNSFGSDEETKNDYLFSPGLIYLNTGTLGPCSRRTIGATKKIWEHLESFPLQFYAEKFAPELAEKTRIIAASFLGCEVDELMMTRSTTDGMNAVVQGLNLKSGDRIITTNQEHEGGLSGWKYLAKYHGVSIDTINIPFEVSDTDKILESINAAITPATKLVSISHVFSSTGLRLPIAEISSLARSKNILCIVDGAQAAGSIKVNVKELGCHAYMASGHKWLMGPKGTGLLYISKDAQDKIHPMQFEDSYNTYNQSTGVGNLPGILGLGTAIEHLTRIGMDKVEQHNISLRNRLYTQLLNTNNLTIVSSPPGALASPLLSCRLPEKIESTKFSPMVLEKHKISFRAVHKQWFNGIRFSTHIFNTEKEVDKVIEIIRKELKS